MKGTLFGIEPGGYSVGPVKPSEPLTLARLHAAVDDAMRRAAEHERIARDWRQKTQSTNTPPSQD